MANSELSHFVQVGFQRFKAFRSFTVRLTSFNILVGPNNAGKSTILVAFRILAAAMRKATSRNAEIVEGPEGSVHGYRIDLNAISVAEENILYNYESLPATVVFTLSNNNRLSLYFPDQGECILLCEAPKTIRTPTQFKNEFNCPVAFVPILGPVEHNERLFDKEAARLALFNYRAARNFRNIWYHYPDRFSEFRSTLQQTWPGMDIGPPEIETSFGKPRLFMFCPEDRIPREIFWSGFGFQVWCQMLTHLIQSTHASIFLIDEPDIYLHSDLQRQLVTLLRNLGPDIVLATHSTEIVTEAEPDEILLIDKRRNQATRLRSPAQLEPLFAALGSNLNPILTQLAKSKRVVFVEGKDFQILGRLAKKFGFGAVGNRSDFAVVPVQGFNPERIRSLKAGMELTLGQRILAFAIFDKDYRSAEECELLVEQCKTFGCIAAVLDRKEIENYLLVPKAMDKSIAKRFADRSKHTGVSPLSLPPGIESVLEEFCSQKKSYVAAQYISERKRFERRVNPTKSEATVTQEALEEFEAIWSTPDGRLRAVPGKDALSFVNGKLQGEHRVSLTPAAIVDALSQADIPPRLKAILFELRQFSESLIHG